MLAEEADGVAHVLGTGRAVQPDGLHVERGECGEHRGDVGAEQHLAAVRQERHRRLNRHAAPGLLERLTRAEDGGLHLEDVLRGLDDEEVGAALHEPLRLLSEHLHQLGERDVAEGGIVRGGQEADLPLGPSRARRGHPDLRD